MGICRSNLVTNIHYVAVGIAKVFVSGRAAKDRRGCASECNREGSKSSVLDKILTNNNNMQRLGQDSIADYLGTHYQSSIAS